MTGEAGMCKQSYRHGTATLPEIKRKFDEVAALMVSATLENEADPTLENEATGS